MAKLGKVYLSQVPYPCGVLATVFFQAYLLPTVQVKDEPKPIIGPNPKSPDVRGGLSRFLSPGIRGQC